MKFTRFIRRSVLQFVLYLVAVFARSYSQQSDTEATAQGVWNDWSGWSRCSVKCSTGISFRTRQCELPLTLPIQELLDNAHKKPICDGDDKQIRICNTHECPPNHPNGRDAKCAKFNARVFNGKKYAWESYINPRKRCELTCKAKGHHFYARLSNRAIDGTVCSTTYPAVCIQGECKEVGCDGIVGSDVKRDRCGICNGDDSQCRTITGMFTRPELSPGYNKIITIPAGSTNINITELRHSKNYLAFRTNHDTILNGNNKVFPSGSYKGLGSTIVYKRRTRMCRTQCAFIPGPINASVDLMVFGFSRNSGIMYSFNVPIDVSDTYYQDLIARNEESENHLHTQHLSHKREQNSRRETDVLLATSQPRPGHVPRATFSPRNVVQDRYRNADDERIRGYARNDPERFRNRDNVDVGRNVHDRRRGRVQSEEKKSDSGEGYSVVLKANAGPDGTIELTESESLNFQSKPDISRTNRFGNSRIHAGDDVNLKPLTDDDDDDSDDESMNEDDADDSISSSNEKTKTLVEEKDGAGGGELVMGNFQKDSHTNTESPHILSQSGHRRNEEPPQNIRIVDSSVNNRRSQHVRIPQFSQRFTFRDRYRALINAKRRQRNRNRNLQNHTDSPISRAVDISSRDAAVSLRENPTRAGGGPLRTQHWQHHKNFDKMRSLAINSMKSERRGLIFNSHTSNVNVQQTQTTATNEPATQSPTTQTLLELTTTSNERAENITERQGIDSQTLTSQRRVIHRPIQLPPIVQSRVPDDDQTLALGDIPRDSKSRVLHGNAISLGSNLYGENDIERSKDRHIIPEQPLINPIGNTVPSGSVAGVPPHDRGTAALSAGRSHVRSGDESLTNTISSTYSWRVSGFSECTTTCGGGIQQTTVVCMDMRSQAVVTDENCGYLTRPKPQAVTCNTRPCPAKWATGAWSSCSATCGPGVETRSVVCRSRVSQTLKITMADESCAGQEKPASRRICETEACYTWKAGNFSECDVSCGQGVRQRPVICVNHEQEEVNDSHCRGIKPTQEEICDMGSCGKGWYFTQWPNECPADCGTGLLKRRIHCAGEEGQSLPLSRCDKKDRPETERTCRVDTPCGGTWFAGEWTKCNATCGSGYKTRTVACIKQLPGGILAVVGDENCKVKEKPETGSVCELHPCQSEWYMTPWSKCSKSCGTGHRTREVKCLDPDQHPSPSCDPETKPKTRETCNTQDCRIKAKPTPTSNTLKNSKCKDSFSQCVLVKKARLCRFKYYSKMCCLSCSGET